MKLEEYILNRSVEKLNQYLADNKDFFEKKLKIDGQKAVDELLEIMKELFFSTTKKECIYYTKIYITSKSLPKDLKKSLDSISDEDWKDPKSKINLFIHDEVEDPTEGGKYEWVFEPRLGRDVKKVSKAWLDQQRVSTKDQS